MSDAEVAEVDVIGFTGRRKAQHVTCRLAVRRVKRLQMLAGDGTAQGELFTAWRHHALVTNSPLGAVEANERHRDHAINEQVITEFRDGPLAHLPSGSCAANAAWLATAVISFNLARAGGSPRERHRPVGNLAPPDRARPRPDHQPRPAPDPAPTRALAMGGRLAAALDPRHQPTRLNPHLTTRQQRPDRKRQWKDRTRPAEHTRPHPTRPPAQEAATIARRADRRVVYVDPSGCSGFDGTFDSPSPV